MVKKIVFFFEGDIIYCVSLEDDEDIGREILVIVYWMLIWEVLVRKYLFYLLIIVFCFSEGRCDILFEGLSIRVVEFWVDWMCLIYC